jgi:4-alpha-glucanotransferase
MLTARESGVLLHVSSLPGPYGHGDLGPEARAFVDFLAQAGQRAWQMLPIHPVGAGNSPYSGVSAFAGNPLLISLDDLRSDGLLGARELEPKLPPGRVDYARVQKQRAPLLRKAFARFQATRSRERHALQRFRKTAAYWLDDYALFMALQAAQRGRAFTAWDRPLVRRDPATLQRARTELAAEIAYYEFEQFIFDRQWRALREHARACHVKLIGDIPIFLAHDSADVWAHASSFQLDAQRNPRHVSGVPPDYFSEDGQLWGTPLYAWHSLARQGYTFWIERLRNLLARFDLVRLDHFIGFVRYYRIPAGAKNARHGRWQKGPGRALFERAETQLGALPFIAEDLGSVSDEVIALRDGLGFPGMRILQFAFGGDARDPFLPHNYVPNTVAYPGTHDNDTLLGWLEERASERELAAARRYVGAGARTPTKQLARALLRALHASCARLVITPMQDLLGLGNRARMNAPGVAEGNWSYRVLPGQFDDQLAASLRELTETYGRAHEA